MIRPGDTYRLATNSYALDVIVTHVWYDGEAATRVSFQAVRSDYHDTVNARDFAVHYRPIARELVPGLNVSREVLS